jgi:TetR/AcrR family transcriptional regulator, fatty acid metabolism regulator protein
MYSVHVIPHFVNEKLYDCLSVDDGEDFRTFGTNKGTGIVKKKINNRRQQAIDTRDRIYSAAIELMERKGFDNITIAEISRKSHVSVGAFYHYFKSKNDILAEIFRKADDFFSTEVVCMIAGKTTSEKIIRFFLQYAKFNVANGVDTTKHLFSPDVKFFIKKKRPMHELLADIIREGQNRGELRNDVTAAELERDLAVIGWGTIFEWNLRDGGFDLVKTMKRRIALMLPALSKSAQT